MGMAAVGRKAIARRPLAGKRLQVRSRNSSSSLRTRGSIFDLSEIEIGVNG